MTRHLFHGTRKTDPKLIYESDVGFDIKYSSDGLNGFAIYFATNSRYSNDYAHRMPPHGFLRQMFMCLVLVGKSANWGGGRGTK